MSSKQAKSATPPADTNTDKASKSNTPARHLGERKMEDAHALIPFVFGVFNQSKKGLRIGQPFLRYYGPTIDIKTGRWTFHARKGMDVVSTAMQACSTTVKDLLVGVTRESGGKTSATNPLAIILENLCKIEEEMVASFERNKEVICQNNSDLKGLIYTALAMQSRTVNGQQFLDLVKMMGAEETSKEIKFLKKLPFACSTTQNESFNGLQFLDELLKAFDSSTDATVSKKYKDALLAQETDMHALITYNMKSITALYKKVATAWAKEATYQKIEKVITEGLYPSPNTPPHGTFEENSEDRCISRFLTNLILERVELLYCHMFTYFAACIGAHEEEVTRLTDNFMNAVVIASMKPILESKIPSHLLLCSLYSRDPVKTDRGEQVLSHMSKTFCTEVQTNIDGLFGESFAVSPFSSDEGYWKMGENIHTSLWTNLDVPGSKLKDENRAIEFDQLFVKKNHELIDTLVGNMEQSTQTLIKSVIKGLPKSKFSYPGKYTIDKAFDYICKDIHDSMKKESSAVLPFPTISHIIYYTQRLNSAFAAVFIFKGYSGETRADTAQLYFQKSKNPLTANTNPITKLDKDGKPEVISELTDWVVLPSNIGTETDVHPIVSRIKLISIDGISDLTKTSRAGGGTQKSGSAKNNKSRDTPKGTKASTPKAGNPKGGKDNQKKNRPNSAAPSQKQHKKGPQ